MSQHQMIFKKCANCGAPVGPHNTERISINEVGLWFSHPDCQGTGLLKLEVVKYRAGKFAHGDPFKGLEIDYYKERLNELNKETKEEL